MDGRGGEHAPAIATEPSIRRLSDSRLLQIVGDGIPSGGMPAFRSLGQRRLRLIVDYLRLLQGKPSATALPGNPAHGRALFFGIAKCSNCHMVRGVGGFLGPDLSDYALAHSVAQIRQAVLNPNRNPNPASHAVIAITRDGRKLVGIARNEDNFSIQIETPDGRLHLLAKSSLAALHHESWSLMPADYKSKLSGSELNDLVSFLVSTANQEPHSVASKPSWDQE